MVPPLHDWRSEARRAAAAQTATRSRQCRRGRRPPPSRCAAGPLHNLDLDRTAVDVERSARRGSTLRSTSQCLTPIVVVSSNILAITSSRAAGSREHAQLRHHPPLLAKRRSLDDIENAGVRAQMVDRVSEILAGLIVDLAFQNDDFLLEGCASSVSKASTRRQLLSPGMRPAPKP